MKPNDGVLPFHPAEGERACNYSQTAISYTVYNECGWHTAGHLVLGDFEFHIDIWDIVLFLNYNKRHLITGAVFILELKLKFTY